METMISLKVRAEKCVGCELCGIVCSVVHEDQARATAMRIRIHRKYPELSYPPFQPMVCRNCSNPACVKACPQGALVLSKDRGEVLVLESNCDGCGQCVEGCPFHAVWVDPRRKTAIKCDLCQGKVRCVQFCSFGALESPSVKPL